MRLTEFTVCGFRSLAQVGPIMLSDLAVLVGPNDAGKSACLASLDFLLSGRPLADDDRTLQDPDQDDADGLPQARVDTTCVEAEFKASPYEEDELDLPATVQLRRISTYGEPPKYQVRQEVCSDVELRDLEILSRDALRKLVSERRLAITGNKNAKQTYLQPLQLLRDSVGTVEEWVDASHEFTARLPQLLSFASTVQADAEAQMRSALQATYNRILSNSSIEGSLTKLEMTVSNDLKKEAQQLCEHIQSRCPELESESRTEHQLQEWLLRCETENF